MLTPIHFPTLKRAQDFILPGTQQPFIVQQELPCMREYLVFSSVDDYFEKKNYYPHCHEVLINRPNQKYQGRLVFDFDIEKNIDGKEIILPENFNQLIQSVIQTVFDKFYTKKINPVFVWLNCENPKKYSKHLVVKHADFVDNWKEQMNFFYEKMFIQMSSVKELNFYPKSIIDKQLVRLNASLRMPYNSKIGGSPMLFESTEFTFHDGLIGLYSNDRKKEDEIRFVHQKSEPITPSLKDDKIVSSGLSELAFSVFETKGGLKNTFKLGNKSSTFIPLLRLKPSKCMVDRTKIHDSDNAYLVIRNYSVYFGCHRGCTINTGIKPSKQKYIADLYDVDKLFRYLKNSIEFDDITLVNFTKAKNSLSGRSYETVRKSLIDMFIGIDEEIEEFEKSHE